MNTLILGVGNLLLSDEAVGVRIVEGVLVTGFTIKDRRITGVKTAEGEIGCEIVVNAAGLWARQLGELDQFLAPGLGIGLQDLERDLRLQVL